MFEIGEFKVLNLNARNGTMQICYTETQTEATASIEIQERIINNIQDETCAHCTELSSGNNNDSPRLRIFEPPDDPHEYWKLIGRLARYAVLRAVVHPQYEDRFVRKYPNQPYSLEKNKFGNELSVNLPLDKIKTWALNSIGNIPKTVWTGTFNSNNLFDILYNMGFSGKTHDIDSIKSNVPDEFKDDFDEGYGPVQAVFNFSEDNPLG